ncbi:MAG: sel1 repeat family protein [Opitutales bacterium]|nr:sel1 repeat family protein [Opitutales bacterium]
MKKSQLILAGTLSFIALMPLANADEHDYAREFEAKGEAPRNAFYSGNYADSAKQFEVLAKRKKNGNQPIYCCELISAALLSGNKDLAFKATQRAVKLLEGFWDTKKEEQAASLWGSESDKVYKGDPYERAMLYFLYGTQLLERGDIENAAAAFRRSLLMDGDTEKQRFQSDFGLPFFLLAKCNYLSGEIDECEKNLQQAFIGACADKNFVSSLKKRIIQEFRNRQKGNGVVVPPSPKLRKICAIGGKRGVIKGFGLKKTERNQEIVDWLFSETKTFDEVMNFDTMAILWNGRGPRMMCSGEHGERRVIVPGEMAEEKFSLSLHDGNDDLSFIGGFGNVNFQATTRGGREMDNVLKDKAAAKNALHTTGSGLMAVGAGTLAASTMNSLYNNSSNPYAALAGLLMLGAGAGLDALSDAVNAEADTRNWRCLPYDMQFACFSSADGTKFSATSWINEVKQREKTFSIPEKKSNEEVYGGVKFIHIGTNTETWQVALHEEKNRFAREICLSQNPEAIAEIITKADSGNADAAFWLGVHFTESDPVRALHYYDKAAKSSKSIFCEARLAIALLLLNKSSLVFDETRGIAEMKAAAEIGIPLAQYYLGCFYANLPGATFDSVPYNREEALRWLRKAAANNVRLAIRELRKL